jgi:predicted helicase
VQSYTFPLYLYPEAGRRDLFSPLEPAGRRPNLDPRLVEALAAAYGRAPEPEEIFGYVYAVLYTPAYRARYAEFLRRDFPRVPFTADAALFAQMAALGRRLVELHLLRSPELESPTARFDGAGDGLVARGRDRGVRYDAGQERVYINAAQYFAPVPEAVWRYRVGGYQVCEKWLKDRQDRRLALDEIRTYCRIVTALGRTIAIQQELDDAYGGVEAQLLEITGPERPQARGSRKSSDCPC